MTAEIVSVIRGSSNIEADKENKPPMSIAPNSPKKGLQAQAKGKGPKTPPRQSTVNRRKSNIITPSNSVLNASEKKRNDDDQVRGSEARRSLNLVSRSESESTETTQSTVESTSLSVVVEDLKEVTEDLKEITISKPETPKKKGAFGRTATNTISINPNVRKVYHLVNKQTGSVGGNGHGGAIYGELTIGSMQKMVELMKEHTGLNSESRFIDVGCGLGKPSIHVAQDPGVAFSYGIEMEKVRWVLGIANMHQILRAAKKEEVAPPKSAIAHKCYLSHGDMTDADYFDPFTHVYMFDIGFPPVLFAKLSDMWNRSKSEFMICYHGPRLMIDRYEFNLELLHQAPTSMHGSSEGHMGYIYRRTESSEKEELCANKHYGERCDPLFEEAWTRANDNLDVLSEHISELVELHLNTGRSTRRTRSKPKRLADEYEA